MKYMTLFACILFGLGCGESDHDVPYVSASRNLPAIRSTSVKPHTSGTTTPESWNSSASTTWYVLGATSDTSLVNIVGGGAVTFKFAIDDTSAANDSAAIKFVILVADNLTDFASMTFADFVRRDSVTVTTEKPVYHVYRTPATTDEPILPYTAVIATGTADNKTLSPSSVESSITWN